MTAGVALAQEFRTTRHVAPQSVQARPPVEQDSNSSVFKKFATASSKWQLVKPCCASTTWSGAQSCGCERRLIGEAATRPSFPQHFYLIAYNIVYLIFGRDLSMWSKARRRKRSERARKQDKASRGRVLWKLSCANHSPDMPKGGIISRG